MSARSRSSRARGMISGSPLSARDRHYSPPPQERSDVPTYPDAQDRHYSPQRRERPNVSACPSTYHYSLPPLGPPPTSSHQRSNELAQLRAPKQKNFEEHKENLRKRAAARGQSPGDMKGQYLWWIKDQFREMIKTGQVHPAEKDAFFGIKLEQRRLELIPSSNQPPKAQRSSGNQQSSRNQRSSGDQLSRDRQATRSLEGDRAHSTFGHPTTSSQSISRDGLYDNSRDLWTPASSTYPNRSETPSTLQNPALHPPPFTFNSANASLGRATQAPGVSTPRVTTLLSPPSGVTDNPQPRVTDEEIHSLIQSAIDSKPIPLTNPASISNKRTASEVFDTTLPQKPTKRRALTVPNMAALIPGYKEMLKERLRKKTEMIKLDIAKQERAKKRAQKAEEKARQEDIAAFEEETAQENRQHAKALRQEARYERFKETYPDLDSDEFSEQDSEAEEFGKEKSISREMAKLLGQIV